MTLLVFGIPYDNLNLSFEGLAVDHSGKACPAVEGIFNLVEDLHVKFVDVNLSGELLGPTFLSGWKSIVYIPQGGIITQTADYLEPHLAKSVYENSCFLAEGFITGTLLLCH